MDTELGILALGLLAILSWVIKYLLRANSNHLSHIQQSIDTLPCKIKAECPEDELK